MMPNAGLVEGGDIKNVTPMYTKKVFDKLPFVACVVRECKGNGLGVYFSLLRYFKLYCVFYFQYFTPLKLLNKQFNGGELFYQDPKHTTQASVHNKAVSHPECGPLFGIGAVILLKQVYVFNPKADKLYLNITLRNIVKVVYLIPYSSYCVILKHIIDYVVNKCIGLQP